MKLFGVINTSPDSLNKESIVKNGDEALKRGKWLLENGADYLDIGGQGSTDIATVVTPEEEWERLKEIIPLLKTFNRELSIDTWRPMVARKALEAGATIINAADGLQNEEMILLAREKKCKVVLPFLSGPDPRHMEKVQGDPVEVLLRWFDQAIEKGIKFGIAEQLILDPGTGFAPPNWSWEERLPYQRRVYQNLHKLKQFQLPLYVALPWRDTEINKELLNIIIDQDIEYGRCHRPDMVRKVENDRKKR